MNHDEQENNRGLQPFGNFLQSVYQGKQWSKQWELFTLTQKWPEIAGDPMYTVTRPAWFRRDVLWIFVDNSAWMQHIHMLKPSLIRKVNDALEKTRIEDIRGQVQAFVDFPPHVIQSEEEIDPETYRYYRDLTATIGNKGAADALFAMWLAMAKRPKS